MDRPEIGLHPMSEQEFAGFLAWAVRDYAAQQVKAGKWAPADALSFAKGEYLLALPKGLATEDSYLYTARDARTGERVGSLFLMLRRRAGALETFVYNLVVDEDRRGRGYGRAIMRAAADWARAHGTASLGLQVFGHNAVARQLYTSLGFRETHVSMQLEL